jgi:hypothetical protein
MTVILNDVKYRFEDFPNKMLGSILFIEILKNTEGHNSAGK